jgi:hypothetical protein
MKRFGNFERSRGMNVIQTFLTEFHITFGAYFSWEYFLAHITNVAHACKNCPKWFLLVDFSMNYKNQSAIQEILAKWQVNQNGNVIHKEEIKEQIKESNELEISTNDVNSHDPIQGELDQLSNKTTIWWIKFPKMY